MLRSLIYKISKNKHMHELIQKSSLALLIKVAAASSMFLMNIIVARKLGATEAGLFFLGFTIVVFVAAFSRMGLDSTLVRLISREQENGSPDNIQSIFKKSITWTIAVSSISSFLIIYFSPIFTKHIFNQPGFDKVLPTIALAIPIVAIYTLCSQSLQGLKEVVKSMTLLNVIVPLITLTAAYFAIVETAIEVSYLYLSACTLAMIIGAYWWFSTSPKGNSRNSSYTSKHLLSSCTPLWIVIILSQTIQWSSQIFMGIWSSSDQIAYFSAAQRTSFLATFILVAVNSIAAPKFSELFTRGNHHDLQHIALWSVKLMMIVAVPAVLFMLTFSEWLLGLFGEEFKSAATALRIMAIGQLINVAAGSVDYLLIMTGHEKQVRNQTIFGAFLAIILGALLIPSMEMNGAAIATAVAIAGQKILGVYQVKKHLGFNTLSFWKSTSAVRSL